MKIIKTFLFVVIGFIFQSYSSERNILFTELDNFNIQVSNDENNIIDYYYVLHSKNRCGKHIDENFIQPKDSFLNCKYNCDEVKNYLEDGKIVVEVFKKNDEEGSRTLKKKEEFIVKRYSFEGDLNRDTCLQIGDLVKNNYHLNSSIESVSIERCFKFGAYIEIKNSIGKNYRYSLRSSRLCRQNFNEAI